MLSGLGKMSVRETCTRVFGPPHLHLPQSYCTKCNALHRMYTVGWGGTRRHMFLPSLPCWCKLSCVHSPVCVFSSLYWFCYGRTDGQRHTAPVGIVVFCTESCIQYIRASGAPLRLNYLYIYPCLQWLMSARKTYTAHNYIAR